MALTKLSIRMPDENFNVLSQGKKEGMKSLRSNTDIRKRDDY